MVVDVPPQGLTGAEADADLGQTRWGVGVSRLVKDRQLGMVPGAK